MQPTIQTQPWTLHNAALTRSTNDDARALPPWHAIRADEQEAGRGRHGRAFVSNRGGLWLSAVLPTPGGPSAWNGFALAVGWAVLQWLNRLPGGGPQGTDSARLRWPNDVMLGGRKLGGILLEQVEHSRCVAGIGINLHNALPSEPGLFETEPVALAEVHPACPRPDDAAHGVLAELAEAWCRMRDGGLASLADELNRCWGPQRWVEARLAGGGTACGYFGGIDSHGALVLLLPDGGGRILPAHHVERLFEC